MTGTLNQGLGGEHATANRATAWDNREFIWRMRSQRCPNDAIARMLGMNPVDIRNVPPGPVPSLRGQPLIASMAPEPFGGEWVLSLYRGLIRVPRSKGLKSQIATEVAAARGLSVDDLTGANTARRYAWPRQELMWRLRKAGWSLPQIGQFLGGRDHTTVLHGCRAYEARLAAMREDA